MEEDLDDDGNTGVINLPGDDEFIDYKKQPWRERDNERMLDMSNDEDDEEDAQNSENRWCKQLFNERGSDDASDDDEEGEEEKEKWVRSCLRP